MLDAQGRITINSDLLEKVESVKRGDKVKIFLEINKRRLIINPTRDIYEEAYFIATHNIDEKGRIFLPASIRKTFPNAKYLPVERDGEIFVLII